MNSKGIYCELVFPRRLGLLTYIVPERLREVIRPGMLVEAPLRKRSSRGVVFRLREDVENVSEMEVLEVKELLLNFPVLTEGLLKLLEWLRKYYLSEEGTILRSMVPSFLFNKKRLGSVKAQLESSQTVSDHYEASLIMEDILRTGRLLNILESRGRGGVIILAPSVEVVKKVREYLNPFYSERLILYHSMLRASELEKNYMGLLSKEPPDPIIIGMRNAVFAPIRPSMIIVLDEPSSAYKQEETPYLHARDVAVMRAYIERIPVILSSEHPSVETFYNVRTGKYRLIEPEKKARQRVQITVQRIRRNPSGNAEVLSERLLRQIEETIRKGERVLLLLPRTGYSLIYCRDCGKVLKCGCEGITIFFREEGILRCRVCESEMTVPVLCPYCKGSGLEYRSVGIERIQEIVRNRFSISSSEGQDNIVVQTAAKTSKDGGFLMGVILDADIILNIPDFRSTERLFHEIYYLKEKLVEGGRIILQTRFPEYEVFRFLRNLDYRGYAISELRVRRLHRLPPFSRLFLLRISSRKSFNEEMLYEYLRQIHGGHIQRLNIKRKRKKAGKHQTGFLIRLPAGSSTEAMEGIISSLTTQGMDVRLEADPL